MACCRLLWRFGARLVYGHVYALLVGLKKDRANLPQGTNPRLIRTKSLNSAKPGRLPAIGFLLVGTQMYSNWIGVIPPEGS